MNLDFSAEDKAFQEEVRDFLRGNLTEKLAEAGKRATSVFTCPPSATMRQIGKIA